MKQIIIELPDNTDWLNKRIDDDEVIEEIKIDNKIYSIPRSVVNALDYLYNQRNMWERMYKNHDIALNILFDERDKRDKGQFGLFSKQ